MSPAEIPPANGPSPAPDAPPAGLTFRPLTHWDDLLAGMEIQRDTWGHDFDDIVSAAMMRVTQKIGGVAAGAFDDANTMVGLVFGMTGVLNGQPAHWSHMLAVRPDYRGQGLGQRLKYYQRTQVRRLGVADMYWTYDPLESRNAHLNLCRLGAVVDRYERDLYGTGETSVLMRGLGTDRLVVRWPLAPDAAQAAPPPEGTAEAPLLTPMRLADTQPLPDAPVLRLAVPTDIQTLKAADPAAALQWRHATRRAFLHYLPRGYHVATFVRPTAETLGAYVLHRLPA